VSNEALNACAIHRRTIRQELIRSNTYRSKKGRQDAHEAIRPHFDGNTPERVRRYLRGMCSRFIPHLDRFVASQMVRLFDRRRRDPVREAVFRATGQQISSWFHEG